MNPEQPGQQGVPRRPANNYAPQQPDQPSGNQPHPQLVFATRPHEPIQPEMSAEVRKRHEESKAKYPDLNLSEGEFVISAIDRHPIGLFQIWSIVGMLLAVLLGLFAVLASGVIAFEAGSSLSPVLIAGIPLLLLGSLLVIFGLVETMVYRANTFFLTNESVIQRIQTGPFSKREQTVSLANIEDASYTQHGVVQSMFNYGMIRLSTEGDETTYRFQYATSPKQQVAILNNAVEAFKNGRPVTGD